MWKRLEELKREVEQPVEELEAEMERERASGQPMTLDLLLMDDAMPISRTSFVEPGSWTRAGYCNKPRVV